MRTLLACLFILVSTPVKAVTIDAFEALLDEPTCLKLNLYHEGRGESEEGLISIMRVTFARVYSKEYPNSICEVVWQRNQFSWTEDGVMNNTINDTVGWERVSSIVDRYYSGDIVIKLSNSDKKMLFYHSGDKPRWFISAGLKKIKRIGNHIFYKK